MITRGTYCKPFNSLRKKRLAAFLFLRLSHQNIEDVAILVHGLPQILDVAIDLDEYFIEMPLVTGLKAAAA